MVAPITPSAAGCPLALLFACLLLLLPVAIQAQIIVEPLNDGVGDSLFQALAILNPINLVTGPPAGYIRYPGVTAIAAYEVFAAYDPTAIGLLFGKQYKQPAASNTASNKRLAACYAIYAAGRKLYGGIQGNSYSFANIEGLFNASGLNPFDPSTDSTTPVGLGNTIGLATAAYFIPDAFNTLGYKGRQYNPVPYQDVPAFVPLNTAYRQEYPTNWQPLRVVEADLKNYVQEFSGHILQYETPFTYNVPQQWQKLIKEPSANKKYPSKEFVDQISQTIQYSAGLNDTTKCAAIFSNGLGGYVVYHLANKYSWSLDDQIKANFLVGLGTFETNIAVFYYKAHYNSARPESVIRFSGLFDKIQAWGGKYMGTVTMNASDWQPYLLPTPPEPEYPSGSVCRELGRTLPLALYVGSQDLGWNPTFPKGGIYNEPGFAPHQDTTFSLPTLDSVVDLVALGRQTGGIHFKAATEASKKLCRPIAENVYRFATDLFNGVTPQKLDKC